MLNYKNICDTCKHRIDVEYIYDYCELNQLRAVLTYGPGKIYTQCSLYECELPDLVPDQPFVELGYISSHWNV